MALGIAQDEYFSKQAIPELVPVEERSRVAGERKLSHGVDPMRGT